MKRVPLDQSEETKDINNEVYKYDLKFYFLNFRSLF